MSWATVTTPPFREDKALVDLRGLNFRCYLPKFLHCVSRQGRRICRKASLFPGYLFFEIEENWKQIFNLLHHDDRNISGLMMSGESPAPIHDKIIIDIKSREGSDGLVKIEDVELLRQRYFKGQRVRANYGPFVGYSGTFDRSLGGDRCRVLFDYMGRQSSVVMRADEISADFSSPRRRQYYRSRRSKKLAPPPVQ